ncbi:MAG: 7,8-dihydro-8-oxoguanine triphosphatase-like [Candidatus Nomurabacteria bacterium]|nr:7,8-dihydro-8-oxoguanine triphosphatase-like [Candidatus Nomurabacteria bacterium]
MSEKIITTNCLVCNDGKILLGLHKIGAGKGRWNGFGGKVHKYEFLEEAARRELMEESGLLAEELELVGVMDFEYRGKDKLMEVNVFRVIKYVGIPSEGREMKPEWFSISEIPYKDMWPDDEYWYPLFLQGKKFTGKFIFDGYNKIIEHSLTEIK